MVRSGGERGGLGREGCRGGPGGRGWGGKREDLEGGGGSDDYDGAVWGGGCGCAGGVELDRIRT